MTGLDPVIFLAVEKMAVSSTAMMRSGKGYFNILKSPMAMLVASAGPAMRSQTPLPME